MARDFKELLAKNMDQVERPKAWPAGHYFGKLGKFTLDDRNRNNTPYARFAIQATSADDDVDAEALNEALKGKPISERNFRKDFFLTDEAEYRLKEMMESIGINVSGRSIGECLPECPGADIHFELTMEPSQDGKDYINNVGTITGVQQQG